MKQRKRRIDITRLRSRGSLVSSFQVVTGGKCKPGDLKFDKFAEGKFEMSVNGKPVTGLAEFGFGCTFLKGDEGLIWEPSSNGDYEIGVNVKEPGGFVKISSIILF